MTHQAEIFLMLLTIILIMNLQAEEIEIYNQTTGEYTYIDVTIRDQGNKQEITTYDYEENEYNYYTIDVPSQQEED